jgi:hypothetical protein
MMSARSVLRENLFLVAAVALPVAVVFLFLAATIIPRWTVPPPAYDLVLRATGPYGPTQPAVTTEFRVRDGRVEAIVRAAAPNTYPQPSTLFLFDHRTSSVRELRVDVPDRVPDGEPVTVVVEALSGRRVLPSPTAPDGYALTSRGNGGGGIVGELFGMSRYRQNLAIVKDGRAVAIDLPAPYQNMYAWPAYAVGWIADDGAR